MYRRAGLETLEVFLGGNGKVANRNVETRNRNVQCQN